MDKVRAEHLEDVTRKIDSDAGRVATKTLLDRLCLPASFLVPFFAILVISFVLGVYPFGPSSSLDSDLYNLYYKLLSHYKEALLSGGSLFYSWELGAGYDFYSYLVGNLSSPLNLLLLFVPDSSFSEAILILQALRVGFAGLAMAWLVKKMGYKGSSALIAACAYSLSSYMLLYLPHLMFFDGYILLPILVWFARRMCDEKHIVSWRFVALLFLDFWCNYYIGFVTSLFLIIYTIFYTISSGFGFRKAIVNLSKLALVGLVTALLSLFFLLPVAQASVSSIGFVSEPLDFHYSASDLVYQLFFGSYSMQSAYGRPMIYCGVACLFLLVLYFFNAKIKRREKVCASVVLFFFVLSLEIDSLYYMWHMFDRPTGLEARFVFVAIFFVILLAIRCFENFEGVKPLHVVISSIAIAFCFAFSYLEHVASGVFTSMLDYRQYVSPGMSKKICFANAILVLTYALLFFAMSKKRKSGNGRFKEWNIFGKFDSRNMLFAVLPILLICELVVSGFYVKSRFVQDASYAQRVFELEQRAETESVLETLAEKDPGDYRIEKAYWRGYGGDALSDGYKGIAYFGSGRNADFYTLCYELGISTRSRVAHYKGTTPITDSLFGIKYVLTRDPLYWSSDGAYSAQSLLPISRMSEPFFSEGPVTVYENEGVMSLAFLAHDEITSVDPSDFDNPFELQNEIMRSAFDVGEDCFGVVDDFEFESDEIIVDFIDEDGMHLKRTKAGSAIAQLSVKTSAENSYFAYINDTRLANDMVDTDGRSVPYVYISNVNDYSVTTDDDNLGYSIIANDSYRELDESMERDEFSVSILMTQDEVTIPLHPFYSMNTSRVREALQEASKGNVDTKIDGSQITISGINESSGKMLVLSLPYSQGWTAFFNDVQVEAMPVLGGLTGVELPEGEFELKLRYIPQGFVLGSTVSLCTLLVCVLIASSVRISRMRNTEKERHGKHEGRPAENGQ